MSCEAQLAATHIGREQLGGINQDKMLGTEMSRECPWKCPEEIPESPCRITNLHAAVVICDTLVNTQTHTHTEDSQTDRQLLTRYAISSASLDKTRDSYQNICRC